VAYLPVCRQARTGPQTGWQVNVVSKRIPSEAIRSKLGETGSFWP
jgi:hypothetical protein